VNPTFAGPQDSTTASTRLESIPIAAKSPFEVRPRIKSSMLQPSADSPDRRELEPESAHLKLIVVSGHVILSDIVAASRAAALATLLGVEL
jgi:hypothetical protein